MTSSALSVLPSAQPVVLTDDWSDERIEFVRRTYCGNAPDAIVDAFVRIARRRGLSPEERQIYLVPRKSGGQVNWVIQTGIDGYRLIAERTGSYAGSDDPLFEESGKSTSSGKPYPSRATVTVWKLVQGIRCPFTATVHWEEYNAGVNQWLTMPHTMLSKCGESVALRKAFPADLNNIYTAEEMDQAGAALDGDTVTVRDVTQRPRSIAASLPQGSTAAPRLAPPPRPTTTPEPDPPSNPNAITRKQRDYILVLCDNPEGDELMDAEGRHLLTASRFDGRMSLNDLTRQEASELIEFIKETDPGELRNFVGELKREAAIRRGQTELVMDPPAPGSPEDLAVINGIVATPSTESDPGSELDWTENQRRWKKAIDEAFSERQFVAIEASIPKDKHGNPDRMLQDYLAVKREQFEQRAQ